MTEYTPAQLTAAHRLAHAYGHHWSYTPLEAYLALPKLTVDAVHALACTVEEGPVGGVYVGLNAEGEIEHRTGSGRLTWTVNEYGDVHLTIRRPSDTPAAPFGEPDWGYTVMGADLADGTLAPDNWADGTIDLIGAYQDTRQRHYLALQEACAALGVSRATFDATYAAAWERVQINEVADATDLYRTALFAVQDLAKRPGGDVLAARLAGEIVETFARPSRLPDDWTTDAIRNAVRDSLYTPTDRIKAAQK